MNIVLFNMSTFRDWDRGIVNRNYFVWRELALRPEVEKIVAVDFLPRGWRKTAAHYWRNIIFEPANTETVYGDLTSACYRRDAKTVVYTTIDSFFSWRTVAHELRRVEKILNLRDIVFWSLNPMFTEFIGRLNEKAFIFDAVDNWLDHPGYVKMVGRQRLIKNYEIIATKADAVFTVSQSLREMFQELGRSSDLFWLPNGTDWRHFSDPQKRAAHNVLDDVQHPVIGYLGTIEERVDFDLLAYIATENPDKTIALCGPIWPSVKKLVKTKLQNLPNVICPGRIAYEDAPSYLAKFDVAVVPHRNLPLVKSMNPMKIYDYLAAGCPVVASDLSGLEQFSGLIETAANYQSFCKKINDVLTQNNKAQITARQKFAAEHSWSAKVAQMMKIVSAKIS